MSPWRPLTALAVVIVALGATMVGTGYHSPKLGIDLAGGTSMTLTAKDDKGTPSAADMNTAVNIMNLRVNATGVAEAEVTKQGNNQIQVDLPGQNSTALLTQLSQTAQLYLRVVVTSRQNGVPVTPAPTSTGTTAPSGTSTTKPASTATPSASTATPSATQAGTPTATGTQHRAVDQGLLAATPSTTPPATPATTTAVATPAAPAATAPAKPAATVPTTQPNGAINQTAPDAATQALYTTIDCTKPPAEFGATPPQNFAVGCSLDKSTVYALAPASVLGSDLTSASARNQATSTGALTNTWEVDLSLQDPGKKNFGIVTGQLFANGGKFAVVVDGTVFSAPTAQAAITDGNAQITGNFTQKTANDLANVLKFGALPISFTQSDVAQVSASLGGNQLAAGLIAGGIGLFLVMLYLVFYYRGLATVAISSLLIAAGLTYSIATLLGPSMNFRLSLAGIAGLVVAIGITADSFVVFFERLRDEIRDGRTLRTGVEHGWIRARRTIIAADFVSFLAAAVLYIVSIGSVRGFAFTLGLTTLIDIVVVFMFTKPMMTLLARTKFFSSGHPWSGLDPERLGVKRTSGVRQTIADRRRTAAGDAEGMEA